jgi:hypothetical protein
MLRLSRTARAGTAISSLHVAGSEEEPRNTNITPPPPPVTEAHTQEQTQTN